MTASPDDTEKSWNNRCVLSTKRDDDCVGDRLWGAPNNDDLILLETKGFHMEMKVEASKAQQSWVNHVK